MGSYPDEFPFNIMDVVELLRLRVRPSSQIVSMWIARSAVIAGEK